MRTPEPIEKFIEAFAKLPSIGPRQATRLAFYIVNLGKAELQLIASAVQGLLTLKVCKNCFYVYTSKDAAGGLCGICSDENRQQSIIMIVEKETDLLSIEKTRKFS